MPKDREELDDETVAGNQDLVAKLKGEERCSPDELEYAFANMHLLDFGEVESKAFDAETLESNEPIGFNQCHIWVASSFRPRVHNGVAVWAGRQPFQVLPSLQLRQLVRPGKPPWGIGHQILLINCCNSQNPFQPFPGVQIQMLGQLLDGKTTVQQWYQIAWQHPTSPTHCHQHI